MVVVRGIPVPTRRQRRAYTIRSGAKFSVELPQGN